MHCRLEPLLESVRNIFHQLSPEDQQELFLTIQELKIEAAEREADALKDPMNRSFALGFCALDRKSAGLPPRPQLSSAQPPKQLNEQTDQTDS